MSNTAEIIQFRAPVERVEHRVADLDDGFTELLMSCWTLFWLQG